MKILTSIRTRVRYGRNVRITRTGIKKKNYGKYGKSRQHARTGG